MKRTYLLLAGTLLGLSTFTACTDEADEQSLSGELRQVVATAENFVPEAGSRAFSLVNNSVEFAWADGDTIGIFPNTGAQAYFPIMAESAGTNTASFTGGGWALKSSSTYAAYYPFVGDFYMNQTEIPVSYEGQKQTGNASMAHLSAYDFMAASGSTPASGKVNFRFAHLGAFVQLKITMPQGGTLTSVTLSADEAVFTTEGTIDLTASKPAIKSVKKSKTLTLNVENVTTTAESNVATLYLMLAPVDFTSKTLSAVVKTGSGSSETITLTGKNFEAGKAYGVSGTMENSNGGSTVGNGTYANGVVSVDVAGNMKKLLGSDYLNITELKVVGPINGDDIYYLRKMLGSSSFSEADWGKLTSLDLSEATIVEGGEWYYKDKTWSNGKYYTSNNVIGGYMFYGCGNLKNIELPVNITSIGNFAFQNCDSLTSIKIPDGVTEIGGYAFSDCVALSAIIIPDGVTEIGGNTFKNCRALASVYISDLSAWCKLSFNGYGSNPLIWANLYLNNNLVTELTIPDDITEIKDYAFNGCESIIKVTIPDHVTSIGISAFLGCSALTNVSIGNSITSIGSYIFGNCSITECYCYAPTPPTINDYTFNNGALYNSGVESDATLYVPTRCGAAYKASGWGEIFTNIIEMD